MIDQQTPHLHLPLPHPQNALEDDVTRLRAAFTELDRKIHAIDALIGADDEDLDTLQEIVDAIKAVHGDMAAINALIDTAVAEALADVSDLVPLIYAGL
jgi:hypothetical protein